MYLFLVILMVVASLLMCFIVLIQNSKGGGLASGFSSSNQIMGVRKTTDFLEKGTWFLAGFMVVMSIATAYVVPTSSGKGGDVILEQAQKEEKTNLVTTGIYSISRIRITCLLVQLLRRQKLLLQQKLLQQLLRLLKIQLTKAKRG